MEALLATYTVEQIVTFLAIAAGALAASWKTLDYLVAKVTGIYESHLKRQQEIEQLNKNIQLLLESADKRQKQIDTLIESDKCRIRAEITREWLKRSEGQTIDYFTLQYLQSQYLCYKAEGGNSYITDLMDEIQTWKVEK